MTAEKSEKKYRVSFTNWIVGGSLVTFEDTSTTASSPRSKRAKSSEENNQTTPTKNSKHCKKHAHIPSSSSKPSQSSDSKDDGTPKFTTEQDSKIKELKGEGKTWAQIGLAVGKGKEEVRERWKVLESEKKEEGVKEGGEKRDGEKKVGEKKDEGGSGGWETNTSGGWGADLAVESGGGGGWGAETTTNEANSTPAATSWDTPNTTSATHGGKGESKWSEEQDTKIKEMKKENKSWKEIAAAVGASKKDVQVRFGELQKLEKGKAGEGEKKDDTTTAGNTGGGESPWGTTTGDTSAGGETSWANTTGNETTAETSWGNTNTETPAQTTNESSWGNTNTTTDPPAQSSTEWPTTTPEPETTTNEANVWNSTIGDNTTGGGGWMGNENADNGDGGKEKDPFFADLDFSGETVTFAAPEVSSSSKEKEKTKEKSKGKGKEVTKQNSAEVHGEVGGGGGENRGQAEGYGRLKADKIWSVSDVEMLETLERRYVDNKWLHLQAGFYNYTGRMIPWQIIREKFAEDGAL